MRLKPHSKQHGPLARTSLPLLLKVEPHHRNCPPLLFGNMSQRTHGMMRRFEAMSLACPHYLPSRLVMI